MTEVRRIGRAKLAAMAAVLAPAFIAYTSLWFRTLQERQSGLSPGEALERAIVHIGRLWPVFVFMGLVAALTAYLLPSPSARARQRIAPEAARTAGLRWWKRYRLLMTVCPLVIVALTVCLLVSRLASGQSLHRTDWIFLWLSVFYVIWLPVHWLVKPTRDALYVLGTGDGSRVDDERAQNVRGRAATNTMRLFVALVLLLGVPYEVLIRGVWPLYSGLAAGAIFLLWRLCSWHWNRKL
jgi:hypothetical protein